MNNAETAEPVGYDDEIDLAEIFRALWEGKFWIAGAGVLAAIGAILVVLGMSNVYRADVVLSPIADGKSGGLANIAGQLGGLASLAGISIGGGSGVDQATLAMETLKSRVFLTDFIRRHELTVPVMAATGWNNDTGEWIIDPEIYDQTAQRWVRKVEPPRQSAPSDLEVYQAFSRQVSISQDKKSLIVTLSVESFSPVFAREWADLLVRDLNGYLKRKDVEQAERSIDYLTRELAATSLTQMQSVLYQLIEEQKKTIMLASVREGYVFQTVDPAVVPEEKVRPKRALIVIIATMFAGFVSALVVLVVRKR